MARSEQKVLWRGVAAGTMDAWFADWLSHWGDPGGWQRDPDRPVLYAREEAQQEAGGVRSWRDRRRRWSRGGQQCIGCRGVSATAGARPSHVKHSGGDACGLPAVRAAPRSAAVRYESEPDLGTDREPLHRQRLPAGSSTCPWPASGCGSCRCRSPGCMAASSCCRPSASTASTATRVDLDHPVGDRHGRLRHAGCRGADRSVCAGADPGAAHRATVAPLARHQPGRLDRLRRATPVSAVFLLVALAFVATPDHFRA